MHIVDIHIDWNELEERRQRCEMQRTFRKPDRVPVTPLIDVWYWLPRIGKTFEEYFSGARAMLVCQILGHKWILENVKCDLYRILFSPVFSYVAEAGTFGAEIEFRKNDIPWVKGHVLENEDDLAALERIDPITGGLHGRELALREEMVKIAGEYEIRFSDGVKIGIADKIALDYSNFSYASGIAGIGVAGRTIGPMLVANDLRGAENMMTDLMLNPSFAARILAVLTDKIIQWISYTKELLGEPTEGVFVGDDGAANLSPELYRSFLLPCHKRIKERFGGYTTFHGDARTEHILPIVATELGIDDYSGFGYLNDREQIAKLFGGKAVLCGNVNPMNLESGGRTSIMDECRNALENFKDLGGFFLKDGDNIPPRAPLENINLMHEAAVKYGRY